MQGGVVREVCGADRRGIAKEEMAKEGAMEVAEGEVEETIGGVKKSRSTLKDEKGEPILPELTDDFAKSVGNFESAEDLKKKLRENIGQEKKMRLREKKRLATLERIATEIKAEIPDILINSESEKMLFRLKSDIERLSLKWDEYLKNVNKTEQELKEGWRTEAEK